LRVGTDELVKLNVPLTLLLVTTWLRQLLKTEPVIVPGLHGFYFYRPQDLADTLRELLNRLPQN
jgi:hypothetical protein